MMDLCLPRPRRDLVATFILLISGTCFLAQAETIYRETFGRPPAPANTGNTNVVNWGWRQFVSAGTAFTTANIGVNGTDAGRPTDAANVNAGPNIDGTTGAYPLGWHYHDQQPQCLTFTPEFSFNPADYAPGSVVFSWYQGNASTAHSVRLIIRVGGVWYASAQTFANITAVANAAAFANGAELKTLTFDPAAANWRQFNFNGDYDYLSGTTTASTLGVLGVGATPGADLSGSITAFGLYSTNNGTSSNRRFDTFTIEGTLTNSVVIIGTNIWTGTNGNSWDFTSLNWVTPFVLAPSVYADNSLVIFDEGTAPATRSVNLVTNVSPGGIIVLTATSPFQFGGPGSIVGSRGLTKLGDGSLVIVNSGTNTFTGGIDMQAGSILVGTNGLEGTLPSSGRITNNGSLIINRAGSIAVNATISGTGTVSNIGSGTLSLSGLNSFAGGLAVNAGTVRLGSATAGGTGTTRVSTGATLVAGAAHSNPITLAGGSLGGISGIAALTGDLTVESGSTSIIYVSDPQNVAVNSEMVFTGTLRGGGNLIVVAGTNNTNPDGGVGFRLRGTAASDFTGTITISNNVKGELQIGTAGPFSPANTGKIILTCGPYVGTNGLLAPAIGGYSELNLRNNSTGNSVVANDVELVGLGLANLNPLGTAPSNSVVGMGSLRIGNGQELGIYLSAQPSHVVAFQSVTLQGGLARFSPKTPDFGAVASAGSDLILNTVGESVPGSGFIMNGLRVLTLTGNSTYTGPTIVSNGTLLLNGNLAGGGPVRIDGGKFTGQGVINGAITVNPLGTISPEGSAGPFGLLEVYGEVTLAGTTVMDLNKTGVGENDSIAFTPRMHFGGTLQLNVIGSGVVEAGNEFNLFVFDSAEGTFNAIVPASPGPGLAWDTSRLYTEGLLRVIAPALPDKIHIFTTGSSVILSGTNGTPGSVYRVLSSTDIALPVASWTPIYTNSLSASGAFSFTNLVNPSEPQRFFILDLP